MKLWSELRTLGNSRVLRTSYIWFILVPVTVKLLDKVESPVEITILGATFSVPLELPFNWELLFYAALAASVGNVIYILRCPAFLKQYGTYSDFEFEGRTAQGLNDEFARLVRTYWTQIGPDQLKNMLDNLNSILGRKSRVDRKRIEAMPPALPLPKGSALGFAAWQRLNETRRMRSASYRRWRARSAKSTISSCE